MAESNKENAAAFSMADLGASLPGAKAGLVNVLKDKLQTLVGTSSGYIESLPYNVKRRVEALQELQGQHKEFETKFFEEKAALEAKYQKLYEPFYKKRFEIVNGMIEVEVAKEVEGAKEEKEEEPKKEKDATDEKGVPEFWLTAMKNNDVVGMQITERDEGALKFLKDITWSRLDSDKEDEKGFKLDFFFNENPYFKNSVLTKTYYMVDENEPILDHATGTEIDWLPGKNLTRKVMKKKPKKGAKNAKPVTKIEQCASFFNFFYPPKVPEDDDVDEDDAEELQEVMEQDYDIGSTIRDKIIPHAVSWFTGEEGEGDDDECISEELDDDLDDDGSDESEEENKDKATLS
uniref:TSA: Wollemia nobilis Ref_Wollemi_Transcript_19153_1957 transcribed RNA sequence n=1 Tax=Wollemia nobilis TaxID=56998 RepID=A0A0C9RRH7_9CONI